MASSNNDRSFVDRINKCIKGSSKADYREFTSACIALARMIDRALAKSQKLQVAPELPQLLKKVCEQKDNEMFQPAIMVLLMSIKTATHFGWFTNTEEQELLLMSKELVDFFTGMGGWNSFDTSQAFQVISKVMPRFYPLLNLLNVIVALEAKPGYEALVSDFYVLKKPSTSEEWRLFVIRKDNLDSSACLVTPNHVNFLVNGKGVEKRTLTSMDGGPQMPSNVTSMLKIGTNLLQIVGDFPGNFLIAIALTTSKADYSFPLDLQIFNHDGIIAQSDEELIEGPSRVSLLCPISHKRIISPVKGASCKHHQCFDYNSFMEINSRRPSWRCPYCNRNVSFPDLRLDLQMLKILKDCHNDAVDVMISENGSWQIVENDEISNAKMGANQSNGKDGSSPNASGDSSAEEGEFRFEKNNSNYIELSDTDDQERQDHENARHSFAIVHLGAGGGGDNIMEDRKPDVSDLPSSTHDQMDTALDGTVSLTTSSITGEISAAVMISQIANFTVPALATEGGFNIPEGLAERQGSREISRPPIAIQALPAQAVSINPSLRVRARSSSGPSSPAHASGGVYPVAASSLLGANQRPLQVQLPSFVGIQDGQVLLHTGHQQLQQDVSENTQSTQTADLRDHRQRFVQQQRAAVSQPFVLQPGVQLATRVSREPPYLPAARNISQIRAAARQQTGQQQQASLQQQVRPESPNLLDNQLWQHVRQQQQQQQPLQLQNQSNNTMSIARDEILPSGLASVAEGVPMFNQSPGIAGAVAGGWRRQQTMQSTHTDSPQYLLPLSNPLIVPNSNVSPWDQRWASSLEGTSVHVDTSSTHLADQMQRRMRGSINISSPLVSGGLVSTNLPWMHAGSSQPSRFLSGVSVSAWSNDAIRHLDPGRASMTPQGTTLQSIQTASTLVSDFDNWFDTQADLSAYHGFGDFAGPRHG